MPHDPTEPLPQPWVFPDPAAAPAEQEAVALGAEVSAATLLTGYRLGLFPMPYRGTYAWLSPNPRGVLRPTDCHVSRSLRRSLRGFEVLFDDRLEEVLAGCADPARADGWITADYLAAYRELLALGWLHGVAVLRSGEVVGGLFGVQVGGVFLAESKFHRATDASKAAVAALCDKQLQGGDGESRLIDVQWLTPHLATLGAVEMPRADYLRELRTLVTLTAPPWVPAERWTPRRALEPPASQA